MVEYVNEKYNIEGKYITVPTISQERILMEVKKYKTPMDFAIISHPDPMNVYFQSWHHDFCHAKIPDENIRYWTENEDKDDPHTFNFTGNKFFTERTMDVSSLQGMHWAEVNQYLNEYRRLYYNPDLQKNRAAGALMQVVDYLAAKKIKAIHLIRKSYIPSWYEFKYGIVDDKIADYQYHLPYCTSYSKSVNAVSEEGNIVAARQIIEYIENYEKYAIEYTKNTQS